MISGSSKIRTTPVVSRFSDFISIPTLGSPGKEQMDQGSIWLGIIPSSNVVDDRIREVWIRLARVIRGLLSWGLLGSVVSRPG